MALYFFKTISMDLCVRDEDGIECATLFEVKRLAKRALYEMATHNLTDDDRQIFTVEVRDLLGLQVYASKLKITSQYKVTDIIFLYLLIKYVTFF